MKKSNRQKKARVLIKRFYRKRNKVKLRKLFLKRAFLFILVGSIALSIASFLAYTYFYNQYEQIVQNRIESGFWQSRAGIYSAPSQIKVGQKTNVEALVNLLRRAGYVENTSKNDFWNGSYIINNNEIEITSNGNFTNQANSATIKIKNGKIIKITNDVGVIASYYIQPEMLTGRSETKRSGNKALKYDQIPQNLKDAIIVTEDRRFYEHFGIDPKSIVRAAWANINNKKIVQGGSTITQQLVKNTFLTNERTFARKFSEAFLALALENKMSKEDIFTLYCNEIYLGQFGISGVHGFAAASQAYFDKNLQDINLAEAITLAAMIKSPNRYTLGKNSNVLEKRKQLIINKMLEYKFITSNQATKARNEIVKFSKPKVDEDAIAPYFVDSVIKELPKRILTDDSRDDDNLRVYTTIDTHLQNLAESAVNKHLIKLEKSLKNKRLEPQATLIAMNPKNGEVLAMVGGSDYSETQFNRATQAKRQPGSTFKPFVYATAIERGILPSKVYADKPTKFAFTNGKPYKPSNFGGYYSMKDITLKTALAKSSNVIAVELAFDSGLRRIADKSREFGFENVKPYPSTALGTSEVTPLQLATAYSTFVNQGKKVNPVFINKIIGGDGSLIYQNKTIDNQIISDKTAYMITDMLRAVIDRGTAQKAKQALGKNVVFAGKTGSSNDGWFVGYTPNLVCVVWVGFDENEDIKSTGGETALPLWVDFMKKTVAERPEYGGSVFPMPKDLVNIKIDPETGMLANDMCPTSEYVIIPKYSASNIKCFTHEKIPETLIAETEITLDFPERNVEVEEFETYIEESENLLSKRSVKQIPKTKEIKSSLQNKKRQNKLKKAVKNPDIKTPKIRRSMRKGNSITMRKKTNFPKRKINKSKNTQR